EDIERARDTPAEEENSARVVMNVVRLLGKAWGPLEVKLDEKLQDPAQPPPHRLDAEQEALLETDLALVPAALAEARKLAGMPRGRHRLTLATNMMNTLLPDQQETRRSASLLRYDALLQAQKGNLG